MVGVQSPLHPAANARSAQQVPRPPRAATLGFCGLGLPRSPGRAGGQQPGAVARKAPDVSLLSRAGPIFSPPQRKLEVSDEMSTGSAALRAASVPAPGGDGGAAGEPRRPLGGLELPLRLRGETRGP